MLVEALEGELVRLRPIRAEDAAAMGESVTEPEGRRLTGTTREFTRAEIDEWCATVAGEVGRVDLAVTAGGSDEYLGEIVLSSIDRVARSAELRLAMRPGYRGRGYGTEAIQLMLGLASGARSSRRTRGHSPSTRTSASPSRGGAATQPTMASGTST